MRNNTNKRLFAFIISGVLLATILIGGLIVALSTLGNGGAPIVQANIKSRSYVQEGETLQLSFEAVSASKITKEVEASEVTWQALNNYATVNNNGVLTAVEYNGSDTFAKVKATYQGVSTVKDIRVTSAHSNRSGEMDGPSSLKVGETYLYKAIFDESFGTPELFWTVENGNAIKVEEGFVTAITPGEATLVARISETNELASLKITVYGEGEVSDVVLEKQYNIATGNTITIEPTIEPSGLTNVNLSWKILTPGDIIKINKIDGTKVEVTGLNEGAAILQVSVGNITKTVDVFVADVPATALKILGKTETTVGEIIKLSVQVTPSNAQQVAHWVYVSDAAEGVATWGTDEEATTPPSGTGETDSMYATMYIKAVKEGNVTFGVRVGEIIDRITISVSKRLDAESIVINQGAELEVIGGQIFELDASILPASAKQKVRWMTSDWTIVQLANGEDDITDKGDKIKLRAVGNFGETATITATPFEEDHFIYEGAPATIKITIGKGNVADIVKIDAQRDIVVAKNGVAQIDVKAYDKDGNVLNANGAIKFESAMPKFFRVGPEFGAVYGLQATNNDLDASDDDTWGVNDDNKVQIVVSGNEKIRFWTRVIVLDTPDARAITVDTKSQVRAGVETAINPTFYSDDEATVVDNKVVADIDVAGDANNNNLKLIQNKDKDGNVSIKIETQGAYTITASGVQYTFDVTHTNSDVARILEEASMANGGKINIPADYYAPSTVTRQHTVTVLPAPLANDIEKVTPSIDKIDIQAGVSIGLEVKALVKNTDGSVDEEMTNAAKNTEIVWSTNDRSIVNFGQSNTDQNGIADGTTPKIDVYAGDIEGNAIITAALAHDSTKKVQFIIVNTKAQSEVKSLIIVTKKDYDEYYNEANSSTPTQGYVPENSKGVEIGIDGTLQLYAIGFSSDVPTVGDHTKDNKFEWISHDESFATVNDNGVVTTKQAGDVHISAIAVNKVYSKELEITVKNTNALVQEFKDRFAKEYDANNAVEGLFDANGKFTFNDNVDQAKAYFDAMIIASLIDLKKLDISAEQVTIGTTDFNLTDLIKELNAGTINSSDYNGIFAAIKNISVNYFDLIARAIISKLESDVDALNPLVELLEQTGGSITTNQNQKTLINHMLEVISNIA
ncbi:MAG: Ig-like domain-containing protein [Firmicutes bacterium]|nr:Ig-like domain-containing protein [Bacillota bacterium]MCL1954300.1 Ig-like domain-containing protein [Bacillota bacterium]